MILAYAHSVVIVPGYGMAAAQAQHVVRDLAEQLEQRVIVIKRSLNPGFAGVENELFYQDKTLMLFGNARDVLTRLSDEVKHLA